MAIEMATRDYQTLWENETLRREVFREEALDLYYSIKTLVEKYFIKENNQSFKAWINISFDSLKRRFEFRKLLEHILIVQEFISSKSYMNEDAFIHIHENITAIANLK